MQYRVGAQCVALDEYVRYVVLNVHQCVGEHAPNDDQRGVRNDVGVHSDVDSGRLHS